jgi:hypothetical protein
LRLRRAGPRVKPGVLLILRFVIPAKAGIQSGWRCALRPWIPAFAGMTRVAGLYGMIFAAPSAVFQPRIAMLAGLALAGTRTLNVRASPGISET